MLKSCDLRRKVEGLSYPSPGLTSIPGFRVNEGRPFKYPEQSYVVQF